MESAALTGDLLWQIWFAILLLGAGVLFLAGLKFGPRFYQRQEKRWLHNYTTRRLEPLETDGKARLVKVKDLDQAAQQAKTADAKIAEMRDSLAIPTAKKPAGK